jgi:hypothetical protein
MEPSNLVEIRAKDFIALYTIIFARKERLEDGCLLVCCAI